MEGYRNAIHEMLEIIAARIPEIHKQVPVKACIAGGVATYLLTEARASDDIDLIIDRQVDLPENLFVVWENNGTLKRLYYDHNYNDTLGLMHEDYPDRMIPYKTIDGKFEIALLHPIDLIISKLSRYSEKDMADIQSLIDRCDIDKSQLVKLAEDAIRVGVGIRPESVRIHLDWVLDYLVKNGTFSDGLRSF